MSASLDRRSAVLTIGGIPLSRVTVCRSGSVDYAAVSDRGGWPKGVREKGWSCARDTASCRSSWKQHFLGKEPREGQWCANLPLREEVEVCVQLGRRVMDCLEGRDNRMRSNRETMLSKTLCRLLLIFFSIPLISHVSFEKIFLSSLCLRPTFETLLWHLCCTLCYTLNPANGLSFPGMEGDGYCSTLDFSLLRSLSYLFRVSDWTSWDFGCALSFLNFERKLSFDKMKGGVWIEIVGSFLFLFRFSLLRGFEKWERINSWLTCKEEIKY